MRDEGCHRGILDDIGSLCRFVSHTTHHVDKFVEGLEAFALGGLDHHRLVEQQREINGRRMETEVQKALGHIQGGHARALVGQSVEDELMLAMAFDRQLVQIAQAFLDIVGIERGHGADLADFVATQREDVGVSLHQHAEISEESRDATQALP